MTAAIGSPAPAFELRDTDKNPFSSASLRGHKSLIVFIPFPFTGNCEAELCMIRDQRADLDQFDANVVVITCDTPFANGAWAKQNGFTFPLLSDFWPHGEVAKAFGAFNDTTGSANRYTFVLDEEGTVRSVINTEALSVVREFAEYAKALAAIEEPGERTA